MRIREGVVQFIQAAGRLRVAVRQEQTAASGLRVRSTDVCVQYRCAHGFSRRYCIIGRRNLALNMTEIEIKVMEATGSEAWGPSGTQASGLQQTILMLVRHC
jgi:hypothetical protein